MSRRDTIIIAVLINAGVLALLFMMAVHTGDEVINSPEIESALTLETQRTKITEDVDSFLKEIVVNEPPQPILIDEDFLEESDKRIIATKLEQNELPLNEEPFVEVTIKRGDALEKIARANGTTVDAIKKANRLSSEKLVIGQVLKVPVGTVKKPAALPIIQSTASEEFYVVKNGDNPWKIARSYHVKFEDLLKLNNLDEEKARKLKEGDKIRVK